VDKLRFYIYYVIRCYTVMNEQYDDDDDDDDC